VLCVVVLLGWVLCVIADGGGWTLLMTLASASQTYTYYDAVWTNTDIHPLTAL
jgi:hypothetical protein